MFIIKLINFNFKWFKIYLIMHLKIRFFFSLHIPLIKI